jgi:hypothetical protein
MKLFSGIGLMLTAILVSAYACDSVDFDLNGDYPFAKTVEDAVALTGVPSVRVDNPVGSVEVRDGAANEMTWTARVQTKHENDLKHVNVRVTESDLGIYLDVEHPRRERTEWKVALTLTVPAGTQLDVRQGVGEVDIAAHRGSTSIDLGVGDVRLHDLEADALDVTVGTGDVTLINANGKRITVDVGTGNLGLQFPQHASYRLDAEVSLGNLTVQGFAEMNLSRSGLLTQACRGQIGDGDGELQLNVGVGNLTVTPMSIEA